MPQGNQLSLTKFCKYDETQHFPESLQGESSRGCSMNHSIIAGVSCDIKAQYKWMQERLSLPTHPCSPDMGDVIAPGLLFMFSQARMLWKEGRSILSCQHQCKGAVMITALCSDLLALNKKSKVLNNTE